MTQYSVLQCDVVCCSVLPVCCSVCVAWLSIACLRHDLIICVAWLNLMRDMTYSYARHDSFLHMTWLIPTSDVTHSRVGRDGFKCVTLHISVCDVKQYYAPAPWRCDQSFLCTHRAVSTPPCTSGTPPWQTSRFLKYIHTWLIHTCNMTYSYVWHDAFIHVTGTHSHVRHDSFICVTGLAHMCDMTHSYAWQDLHFGHATLKNVAFSTIQTGVTHSYVWHVSFIRVTWLIHTCDMTHMRDREIIVLIGKEPMGRSNSDLLRN